MFCCIFDNEPKSTAITTTIAWCITLLSITIASYRTISNNYIYYYLVSILLIFAFLSTLINRIANSTISKKKRRSLFRFVLLTWLYSFPLQMVRHKYSVLVVHVWVMAAELDYSRPLLYHNPSISLISSSLWRRIYPVRSALQFCIVFFCCYFTCTALHSHSNNIHAK